MAKQFIFVKLFLFPPSIEQLNIGRYKQTNTSTEGITVWLTFCWFGLDSTKPVNLLLIKHQQSS